MSMRRLVQATRPASLGAMVCWLTCWPVHSADASNADKSGYTLFHPTPEDKLRDFSPDRPSRVTGPYSVDAGHFQIETDFLSFTFQNQGGTTTRTYQTGDPVLKLGLTNSIDFEVALGGYENTRVIDNGTRATLSRGSGLADVTLSSKINLIGNDGGKIAFAIEPYLRVPSGTRNISDNQVEGGILAPVQFSLPSDFSLTLQTELDALANQNGPGTHLDVTDIVSLSHPVPGVKNLTGTVEVYSSLSLEPHTPDTYTFDVALAYLIEKNTQLDAGLNVGLNRGTPDYQAYTGIARRF